MSINPMMKALAVDVAERVFWTFLEAFLGIMIISPVWNVSALHAAAMAGLAALVTYGKATISTLKPNTLSPASTVAAPGLPALPPTLTVAIVPAASQDVAP